MLSAPQPSQLTPPKLAILAPLNFTVGPKVANMVKLAKVVSQFEQGRPNCCWRIADI